MDINQKLRQICRGFRIQGEYAGYEHIKVGNVNQTYQVTFHAPEGTLKHYIVQTVNTYAFRKPEQVMHNIDLVTEHIRAKKPGQVALHFHHTADRKTFISDADGFWRLCNYIPSNTYNSCSDPEILRGTGEAFGEFQLMLADFDASQLYETIVNFHNTPKRIEALFRDAQLDPLGRAAEVQRELDYIASVREEACRLTRMQEAGQLPLRVTHNDTKINNVLFDRRTSQAVAVIDLDTVMPGLVGHDFGDAVRFASNFVAEDSPDWQKAGCNLEVFRLFTEGFLAKTAGMLTQNEIDTLALSPFVLAVELAGRFLDDYLLGDLYFKINSPKHNLVRARCQLALARDLLDKQPQMDEIIHACASLTVLGNPAPKKHMSFTI